MITIVNGDILKSKVSLIVQQVNHQGVMGAGLAKKLSDYCPGMLESYREFCSRHDFESIKTLGMVHFYSHCGRPIIANVFGQNHYGRNKCYTDYESLTNGLIRVRDIASACEWTVAIPYGIGCGLAGGSWDIVSKIINETFGDYQLDVKLYQLER